MDNRRRVLIRKSRERDREREGEGGREEEVFGFLGEAGFYPTKPIRVEHFEFPLANV